MVLLILLLKILKDTRLKDLKEHEQYEQELINKIQSLNKHIEEQENKLHHSKIDKTVNLPNIVVNVLDTYERSHIRIPQDIIESLSYEKFYSESDVKFYIENQRHYWKLENTKKPMKDGVLK